MPRAPRATTVLDNTPHHVVFRGNNRRRIFSHWNDYKRLLHYMKDALGGSGCLVHALVLMGNHVHMLVTPESSEQLAKFIGKFCQRFALYRNRTRDGSGKLFEERYSAKPIASEAQAAATLAYIELNPVRARLRSHPALYPWSTCGLHTGHSATRISRDLWTPLPWYEELGHTAESRARRYEAFILDMLVSGRRPDGQASASGPSAARYTRRLERPDRTRAS